VSTLWAVAEPAVTAAIEWPTSTTTAGRQCCPGWFYDEVLPNFPAGGAPWGQQRSQALLKEPRSARHAAPRLRVSTLRYGPLPRPLPVVLLALVELNAAQACTSCSPDTVGAAQAARLQWTIACFKVHLRRTSDGPQLRWFGPSRSGWNGSLPLPRGV
jgi:hypothetical protein